MPDYLRSPTCWLLFLGAGLATGMLTPVVMWLAKWIGAVDGGGYRKVGACGIARLGGPAIALPFVVACLLGLWGPTGMLGLIEAQGPSLLVLAFGCAAIVGLGIVDDSRGLRARHKLLVQIAVAAVVCASGHVVTSFALPFVGTIHLGYVFGTIFTLFWIVGLINAFNLIDGVDGLAAGIALIGSVALAILAAINGATFVVLLCLALSGSLLAFLPFNFYPARVYLGDSGSMFLGFALATIALMGSFKSQAASVLFAPILALGVPISETLASMARRYIRGRPLFTGDQSHTHHRLLREGYSPRQVAILLYVAALLCAVAATLSAIPPMNAEASYTPIALYIATIAWIALAAGYIGSPTVKRLLIHRQRNVALSAFARYAAQRLSSNSSSVTPAEVLNIGCKEMCLDFVEVRLEKGPLLFAVHRNDAHEDCEAFPDTARHEIRVRSANGYPLIVRYRHDHDPGKLEQEDVAACIAHLFEQTKVKPPGAAS